MTKNYVVLFTRIPRLGHGKKRLAKAIGPVAALWFQRHQLQQMIRNLGGDRRWQLVIAKTPRQWSWPNRDILQVNQGQGDLGTRMERMFLPHPLGLKPGPIVLIGSDLMGVTAQAIAQSFKALGQYELVFGPASDGGFWMVGAQRRPYRSGIFKGVKWSQPDTLAQALNNGPKAKLMATLSDVDDFESYQHWRRILRK